MEYVLSFAFKLLKYKSVAFEMKIYFVIAPGLVSNIRRVICETNGLTSLDMLKHRLGSQGDQRTVGIFHSSLLFSGEQGE